jgi:rubrerythrin
LNEDLSREYQAIISYVVYSQVLKGAEFMSIAGQLEAHAQQELKHALIISKQIDYLGKMPTVTPKPVRTSEKAKDMLRFDLDNENETIKNTAQGFDSVKRSANLPWPSLFGKFSWMSRTTKSTWRRRSVWKFRTLAGDYFRLGPRSALSKPKRSLPQPEGVMSRNDAWVFCRASSHPRAAAPPIMARS